MGSNALPAAAGAHEAATVADADELPRPELVALVPARARVVVDVGCGQGALGGAIRRERGAWVLGLEPLAAAAEAARGRLDRVERVDLDALEELPVAIGSVDAFVCGDVLEHLRDPERLLCLLRRYLAPGGVIVAAIPNVKHWSVLAPLLLEDRFTYARTGLLDPAHVHLFTLQEISSMLDRVGLEATHLDAVRLALPDELRPIAGLVAHWGGDVTETIARLEASEYLLVARSTEGGR